jgi:glycosyltransferase involved in cell wall biosynthesis
MQSLFPSGRFAVDFSVLIPTYNRAETLKRTLQALAAQSAATGEFEVLVVDDGSTDQTPDEVRQLQEKYPVPLHYYYQPNRKQGVARNLGAQNAKGRFLVFLGDDTVPISEFLEEHRKAHELQDSFHLESSKIVVIGYTTWPDHFARTRFLEYVGEKGWQFGFSLIEDPEDVPFNFFYTSNLSLSRRFFLGVEGFDEDFHEYGWEDIELSVRLKAEGMRIVYHSAAVAHHYHPMNLRSFLKRQRKVGYSAWDFYRRHPELGSFLSIDRIPRYRWRDHLRMRSLAGLCRLFENKDWPDLSNYYPDILSYYYMLGMIAGEERGEHGP